MESRHAKTCWRKPHLFSARVVSCPSEGANSVWLIWLITADPIWSRGNKMNIDESRWNQMKQSYCALDDVAGSLVQRICLEISWPKHATAYLGCHGNDLWLGSPLQTWAPAATNQRSRQHPQLNVCDELNNVKLFWDELNRIKKWKDMSDMLCVSYFHVCTATDILRYDFEGLKYRV